MNIYPIQTNFTSGILSPRLWSRSDTQEYRNGVKDSSNMITLRQGPMESRKGSVFVESLGDVYSRPFGFQLIPNSVTGEAFSAVVSDDLTLKVLGATGTLYEEELANNSFTLSLENWNKVFTNGQSSVNWSSGSAILNPEPVLNGERAGVSQFVTVTGGTENDDRTISFTSITGQFTVTSTTRISVGTTEGDNDLLSQDFAGGSGNVVFNPSGATNYWITFSCVNEQVEPGPGGPEDPTETYGSRTLLSTSSSLTSSGAVEFVHTWTAADIQNLHVEMSPNESSMYFVCQNVAPQKLDYDLSTDTWSFGAVVFTAQPADWIVGNFPTTMGFFQGRSWWAGIESKPQTFWGSRPNDDSTPGNELEDLTLGVNADDALEFTLSRSGRIRWIEGGRNLIIGTTSGEFLINGSGGIITPDDIFVSQQSAEGGDTVNARKIGNMIMFISGDGRRLLSTRYYEDQNQWRAQEISFTAENITEDRRIIQIAYARNPESIIWCLLDDGCLVGCTYDPFNNLIGWHKHSLGFVQGITTVEKSGFSILSATVQRVIDGSTVTYLEELGLDYMDSYTTIETTSVNITVPHLAGETVQVKIDDAQHPDITLDSNGDGTLEYFTNTAVIGLSMPIFVFTLEPDLGSQAGTSMGFNKRWSEITARVVSSALPEINGERPKVRKPATLQGYREPNETRDVTVKSLGYNDGSILISQALPYKLTLTGIFGKMAQNHT
jgi:hypothetical protein